MKPKHKPRRWRKERERDLLKRKSFLFLHLPFEKVKTREEEGRWEFLSSLIQPKTRKKRGKIERGRRREQPVRVFREVLSEVFEVRNHRFIVKSTAGIAPPRTHLRVGKPTWRASFSHSSK
jgi:hypothetical protein